MKFSRMINTAVLLLLLAVSCKEQKGEPEPPAAGDFAINAAYEDKWDVNRVLKNPDKGLVHHYHDMLVNRYASADATIEAIPGLHHLYIRLPWAKFEPAEGQYDWSLIDNMVTRWVGKGYGLSFRIVCKSTSETYATPEWVINAGAKGKMVNNYGTQRWEPDYGDPVFLQKLENFHRAMAARYDGAPWLTYVDVGSIGDWGEGHTNPSSNVVVPTNVVRQHLEMYRRVYPKSQLVVTDDLIKWRRAGGEITELRNYVEANGFTYRDDSPLVAYYINTYPNSFSVADPELFEAVYQSRPTILETQHYSQIKTDGNWSVPDGAQKGASILKGAIKTLRATYVGYHGFANTWLADNPQLAREVANLCGYWYFLKSVKLGKLTRGQPASLETVWYNRGAAPGYEKYPVYVKLVNNGTQAEYLIPVPDIDSRTWIPESEKMSTGTLNLPADMVPGTYRLKIGLQKEVAGQPGKPIDIGFPESMKESDGYFLLADQVRVQ